MRYIALLFAAVWLIPNGLFAQSVDYQSQIKPLLAEKCGACHGALNQEAGLRLDAGVLIHQGGDSGPVISPGKSSASPLIEKVAEADPDLQMPPEGEGERLTEQQVTLLASWVDAGADYPQDETIPVDPREHWAYQVPQRPSIPPAQPNHGTNPVDILIGLQQQAAGVTPVDPADPYTLLRRVYFDLIGLPPTRQQIESFVQEPSPEAWRRLVDDLLDSPQYGQRWGRHWMDVWRYSDWDGYKNQLRGSQRHIWHWREWIVDSLNDDQSYAQMLVEMLAGDELAPQDPKVLAATGFVARNYHHSNRNIWLDATVEHTAKAFLGLTLNCARCHDHKYDPIQQTAYYQFRAVFEPHRVRTDPLAGQLDLMKDGLPRAYDADLDASTFVFIGGNEKHADKEHPLAPAVPAVLGGQLDVKPVQLPVNAYYPSLRDDVVRAQLDAARKRLATAEKALSAALAQAESAAGSPASSATSKVDLLEQKKTVAQLQLQSLEARLAADRAKTTRGDAQQTDGLAKHAARLERQFNLKKAQLTVLERQTALQTAESKPDEKAALAKARKDLAAARKQLQTASEALQKKDHQYTPFGPQYPRTSSGRRLALARWIVSRSNPLTARVAVNHVWMRHFGSPLVDNVFDFGLRSPRPQLGEVLDWLAVEFMEHDWSMKHLHRLILTSRTWQLASTSAGSAAATSNQSIDPDNRLLWRMNIRRLDAEIVRDSVLAVAGQLDTSLGGPEVDFRQGEASRRRSIYLQHAYEKQPTMLVLFDAASPIECYRRSESIIPQQALALSNSSLSLGQSRRLAGRLWQEALQAGNGAEPRFIRAAFLQVLSRPPTSDERSACQQFLVNQATTLSEPSELTTFEGGSDPSVKPAQEPQQRAREPRPCAHEP